MSEAAKPSYAWVDDTERRRQSLTVEYAVDAITAHGRVTLGGETPTELDYVVVLDPGWRTREVTVTELSSGRRIVLIADGEGAWESNGAVLPELQGALDVDLSATPFTNTLPIRRSPLAIGEHLDIVTAWVGMPELTVMPDPQRYTRVADRSYRFDSLDSDFTRDITVDDDGFVVDYPGLFTRVPVERPD